MDIGTRIKQLREQKGISQSDLARMVGITKQSLYKYENAIITNIPSSKIESLASKLDTTPAYLMGWVDEKTEKKNDIITDVILRLRTDDIFINVVNELNELSSEQLLAVQTMLSAFKKQQID